MDNILEIINKFLKFDFAMILVYVLAINALLMGVKSALEIIKDKTASQLDNKIYDFLNKVLGIIIKIVDFLSANKK